MRKRFAIVTVFGCISLAACGSKTEANEKNFEAALTQYFDQKGELCVGTKRWPVDLEDWQLKRPNPVGVEGKMAALEAAGLAESETLTKQAPSFGISRSTHMVKVKRYTLTDAAKPFVREKDAGFAGVKYTDFCWGKKTLDKVVKWEGPMKLGDYQEARVTYTYKVDNVAEWARRPDIQAAFPAVKLILEGSGSNQAKHLVKLTSQGWEAAGLD